MEIVESKLAGVKLVKPKVFGDHRGFFMESYNEKAFHEAGIDMKFIQDNHSLSVEAGVLRVCIIKRTQSTDKINSRCDRRNL